MAPSSSTSRSKVMWLVISLSISLATAAGIAIRAAGRPEAVPWVIQWTLIEFVEPGNTIWWFTIGGVFQAYPYTGPGYAVAAVGNIAFWLLIAALAAGLVRFVRRRIGTDK